jgi:hypothetical protein
VIKSGPVTVLGDVVVDPNAALIASYALHGSRITVDGSIYALSGATVVLGCQAVHFPCADDNSPVHPTLTSSSYVAGSLEAFQSLGVLVHSSTIRGQVVVGEGGGGVSCAPKGAFAAFGSPPYTDLEDNSVGGNVVIADLASCWFGALRNHIGGSLTVGGNTMADPDSMEVLANVVAGNAICGRNSPANQFGDSQQPANIVSGYAIGQCGFGALAPNPAPKGPKMPISVPPATPAGYTLVGSDGGIFNFGTKFWGSAAGQAATPVVGIAGAPGGGGYCLATQAGQEFDLGIQPQGCASLKGPLNQPLVGTAALPEGGGNYMAASDGGVFTSGAALFWGSLGNVHLNKPVVGIAASPYDGYWMVASDGGIFTFGPGAKFYGSTGNVHLNKPIVGMAMDPQTGGYWLVASDGGIFSFNAPFYGSLGNVHLNQPIVGMAASPTGNGYYLVAADGGIFTFGPGAKFRGSLGAVHLDKPIVGMTLG